MSLPNSLIADVLSRNPDHLTVLRAHSNKWGTEKLAYVLDIYNEVCLPIARITELPVQTVREIYRCAMSTTIGLIDHEDLDSPGGDLGEHIWLPESSLRYL